MQALPTRDPSRSYGDAFVPAGVAITLIGVLGDLVVHSLNPEAHAHEQLVVLGRGNNPWHLVLFLGIVLTAVGGIRWVSHLGSEWAALVGAGLVLLLTATVATGGMVAWREGRRSSATSAGGSLTAGATNGSQATGVIDHSHSTGGASTEAAANGLGLGLGEGAEGASHTHGRAEPISALDARVLNEQLAEARAASAKYRNVERAKAAGYFQVTQFIPTLGLHMTNLKISERKFDPRRPQVLLYEPTASGGLKLVGLAYTLYTDGDAPPQGFAGGGDVWHFHNNLCFLLSGSVTIAPSADACKAQNGLFQARTAWLLHVWLWKQNPNGIFTEANPQVF